MEGIVIIFLVIYGIYKFLENIFKKAEMEKRHKEYIKQEELHRLQLFVQEKEIKSEVKKMINNILGGKVNNRHDSFSTMYPILMHIHNNLGIEALIVMFINDGGILKDIDIRYGSAYQVCYPEIDILKKADKLESRIIVIGHNHPNERSTPSDADVLYSISLEKILDGRRIKLMDSLVVCKNKLKSVFGTKRYRDLKRPYLN